MIELEMGNVAKRFLVDVGQVEPDHEVVVITDPEKVDIGRLIANVCRQIGATTTLSVKPRLESHGNEPPRSVAASMMAADVMIDVNTHAMIHTDARRAASASGTRYLTFRGVEKEMMYESANKTDWNFVERITEAAATVFTQSSSAHVHSPEGTDISVSLEGRTGMANVDVNKTKIRSFPPLKAAVTPVEGTAQGTIVFDYSFDNLGLLDEPMTLTFEDGLITEIEGGVQAKELETLIENTGKCARNLAEAPSLGTNPDIELTGNQATDKKKLGVVNFAIGDNKTLGGDVECDIHLDGIILNGTVKYDGETLIENGDFDVDKLFEMADIDRQANL